MSRQTASTPPALRLRELPATEQPRTRLVQIGTTAVSDGELLAILLRSGTDGENAIQLAQRLLIRFGGWTGLRGASIAELSRVHGIGAAKAATIHAAIEIGRRLLLDAGDQRLQIRSPSDMAQLLQVEMAHLDQEHFRVVALDTKHHILAISTIYIGSLNSAVIRVGEVFKEAIRLNAAAIIICHNHPSKDPTPSPEDVLVTRQIVEAGDLLDITVLDHLIVAGNRYVSLRERGLGFKQ